MNTKKLKDGTLIVPFANSKENQLGDGYREIKPNDLEYQEYFDEYQRQQELEKKLKEIVNKNPDHKEILKDW